MDHHSKGRLFCYRLMFVISLAFLGFLNTPGAGEETFSSSQDVLEMTDAPAEDIPGQTRILLQTSGPAEFTSYWLEQPPRLVVEFHSPNVTSQIKEEVIVNQGVMKRITSHYAGRGAKKSLESLTFEFSRPVPYKIGQEGNAIFLDIQDPLETSFLDLGQDEINLGQGTGNVILKRLEAMDLVLAQAAGIQKDPKNVQGFQEKDRGSREDKAAGVPMGSEIHSEETGAVKEDDSSIQLQKQSVEESPEIKKNSASRVLWPGGLILFLGLGFLAGRRSRKKIFQKLTELSLELQEKDKFLQQEKMVLKAIENTSLKKDKENEQLKKSFEEITLEMQEKNKVLGQREESLKQAEQAWLKREEEYEELEKSLESIKWEWRQTKENLMRKEREITELKQSLLEKEKECQHLEDSLRAEHDVHVAPHTTALHPRLSGVGVKKGQADTPPASDGGKKSRTADRFPDQRAFPRLELTRDYNRTILLRFESPDSPRNIKAFANNISQGGLCFETRKDLQEGDLIDIRLFFYGDQVPSIKIQSRIIWKWPVNAINLYGLVFVWLLNKDKDTLTQYLVSKKEILENAMSPMP